MIKFKKYFKLFTSCMFLSSFTFGGGYVIIPLMERKFVEELKWLDEEEVLDITSIAQSSPGSIAVNAALLLGYRVLGIWGAIVALLGTVLPSLVIVTLVTVLYDKIADNQVVRAVLKGMQAGVAALICNIALNMTLGVVKTKNAVNIIVMATAFVLIFFFGVNVAYVILVCLAIGILRAVIENHKIKKDKNGNQAQPSDNVEQHRETVIESDFAEQSENAEPPCGNIQLEIDENPRNKENDQ